MDNVTVTKDLENKTLTIERTFNASRERLWRAYADKEWFERWWGPEGWETTVKEFDFVQGGKIHYGMKCVDENQGEWFGKEAWGIMILENIDEPNSFSAQDHFCSSDGVISTEMPAQKFTVEFMEEGGQTRLITRSVTETSEALEELVNMGMIEGFGSQLDKLERLLAD